MSSDSKLILVGLAAVGGLFVLSRVFVKGREENFPVDNYSVAHVQGLTIAFIKEGNTSHEVRRLRDLILNRAGVSLDAPLEQKAAALHRFVADQIPFVDDPPGTERMQSPTRMASRILKGEKVVGDCDDLVSLLGALAVSAGIPASAIFLDTDGDGIIDHVLTSFKIGGNIIAAETTIVGVQLGWRPPGALVETLPLTHQVEG